MPTSHHDDVDAECRALVRALGEGGWPRYAVGGAAYGGADDTIDTRSICLIARNPGAPFGPRRFRLRHAGPRLRRHHALRHRGTEARLPAPRRAPATAIAAFALSEPDAGSDVAALGCAARRDGDGYVLDGEKTWISNGGIADFYVVFARTGEAPGSRGISAFIVDAGTPGFADRRAHRGDRPAPAGAALLHRLPHSGVAPCSAPPAQGFKVAMRTLDIFRTSVAAAALGFARRALDEALARATTRTMFNQKLADFQLTQAKLAQMATAIDAAALLTYRAAWLRDQGKTVTREAAMAKLTATESAQTIIDGAVQIFGGLGVVSGEPVEKLYREIRALRIYEGASEVQQLIVARELLKEFAAKGAGP